MFILLRRERELSGISRIYRLYCEKGFTNCRRRSKARSYRSEAIGRTRKRRQYETKQAFHKMNCPSLAFRTQLRAGRSLCSHFRMCEVAGRRFQLDLLAKPVAVLVISNIRKFPRGTPVSPRIESQVIDSVLIKEL